MTPDAPRRASATTTCLMRSFPFFACSSLAPPIEINTPPTIIAIKQKINITVITIFVNHARRRGNAVAGVTSVVLEDELERKLIQLPTNGTLVFNDIHHKALHEQRSGDHQLDIQEL